MALREMVAQDMLETSRGPTLLEQFQARQRANEEHELNKLTSLSNLETARVGRESAMQEMDQSKQEFSLAQDRMKRYSALAQQIRGEQDPEKQYKMSRGWYEIAAETGDTVGMQMALSYMKSYSPSEEYGYQEQVAQQELDKGEADIGLTRAQTEQSKAYAGYIRSGKGGNRYKAPPLITQTAYKDAAKPFIEELNLRDETQKKSTAAAMYQAIKTLTSGQYQMSAEEAEARVRQAAQASVEDDGEWDMPGFGSDMNRFNLEKFHSTLYGEDTELSDVASQTDWRTSLEAMGVDPVEFERGAMAKGYTAEEAFNMMINEVSPE